MHRVLYVPLQKIRELWPLLSPFIARAMEHGHGEYTLEQVLDAALEKKAQLWGIVGPTGVCGAVVTRVVTHPSRKALHIMLLGGDGLMEWGAELDRVLSGFARDQGCQSLQVYGRPGWARRLPLVGYSQQYVVMGKELGNAGI